MKKFFAFAALAVATLAGMTSCSSDDAVEVKNVQNAPTGIEFNISQNGTLITRATPTTSANWQTQIADFMVWGYFAPTATGTGVTAGNLYMGTSATVGTKFNGVAGTYTYDNATDMVYWPATSAKLNFQAITPAPTADGIFTISNTPAAGLAKVTAMVTVPTECDEQVDIMFAKADNQDKEAAVDYKAALDFKHGLTQVVFAGKAASENITAVVSSIQLCQLYDHGNVGFFGASSALTSETTGTNNASFSPILKDTSEEGHELDLTINSTEPKDLNAADGALLMLPQTVTGWDPANDDPKTITQANFAHKSYMKIHVTSVTSKGAVLMADEDIYIPLSINWEQGKKYVYTIIFGQGTGGYDEDGEPLDTMVPITFSVSQTDWVAADPQPTVSF